MKSYKWWANWPSFSLNTDHRSQRHISWMKATLSHSSILSSSFFLTLLYFYSQNQQLFSSHSVFREVNLFIYFYSHKSLHQKTKMLISYRLRWVWHIWVILSMRGKPNSTNLPFPNHVEGFANLMIKQQTPIFPPWQWLCQYIESIIIFVNFFMTLSIYRIHYHICELFQVLVVSHSRYL